MIPRPVAVRFGIAAAAILTGLYAVGALWRPIPNVFVAAVFLCALAGLIRGSRWAGFGSALFLLAGAAGIAWTATHIPGPLNRPLNLAVVVAMALSFATLLFLAGRALPPNAARRSASLWLIVSIATLAFTIAYDPFVVPSGGMENTMLVGDSLYVRLTGASFSPSRGDIVVFRYPPNPQQVFAKRIVGVPGDRVRLANKTLIVNGAAQNEPYAIHGTSYLDPFRDNFPAQPNVQLVADWATDLAAHTSGGDVVVPPGKYFVLGDNRDDSLDSRYWGFVPRDAILGTPSFISFSAEVPADQSFNTQQFAAPILFTPSRIRWRRLFHPVR